MSDHILYYAPDNASLIVRLALEELGAPYETRLVDRRSREQESASYRKLNPNGLIPACVIDGEPVFETAAILLTLSERHGALMPAPGAPSRARMLKWLFFLSNTLHSDLRQAFYPSIYVGDAPDALAAHRAAAERRIARSFDILNAALEETPGIWMSGGNSPSIVDLYIALCARWAQIYPVAAPILPSVAELSAVMSMLRALEARPAIQRACAAEGIAAPFFSAPTYANPPEGSAL